MKIRKNLRSLKKVGKNKLAIVIISSIAAIIFLFLLFFLLSSSKDPASSFRPKPFVEISQVSKQIIFDQVEALGTANSNESVEITANVSEIVDEIKFSDNMSVKKGDDIVILQSKEELAQKGAEELQLKEHLRELARLETLVRRNAATKQQLDQRKTLTEISKQKINEIEAKISDRIIKAPFDGILGLRNISKGTLVRPGDLITTIDDISKIKIDFSIPTIYLSNLYPQMPITARSEVFKGRDFKGFVSFIDSRIDENTSSIKVRAIIDNEDLVLRPGLLLNITLFKNERSAIIIPEESILARQDKHYLFVLNDGNKVEKREVEIGKRENGLVEITNNLNDGEKVVTKGIINIDDGTEVQLVIKN